MKRSKLLISIVVALTVVSMVFSSVLADGIPPVTVDPGEEESTTPADWEKFTAQPENFVPSTGLISVDGFAVPISPVYEYVYTKKPTFFFNRDFSATSYQIEVYSEQTDSVVYYYQGAGTCTDYYCTLKPDTKLKIDTFWNDGEYSWRIRSYVGGWQPWSMSAPFKVLTKGFDDSFLTYPWLWTSRWSNVQHSSYSWVLTATKSQLKAPGELNWWSTVYAQETFNDVDVTIRMKRKYNETNSNVVLIWSDLFPASSSNELHDGIYFQYNNAFFMDGLPNWSVWMMKDGVFSWIHSWTPSDAIVPFGWNELRIVGRYPYIDLWINGTYLGWYQVNAYGYGMVAISTFYGTPPSGPLLVDWVKAKPIPYGITMEHDPAMQLGLDAGPATMEEVTGSK